MITPEKIEYLKALNNYIKILKEVKTKYGLTHIQQYEYKKAKEELSNVIQTL